MGAMRVKRGPRRRVILLTMLALVVVGVGALGLARLAAGTRPRTSAQNPSPTVLPTATATPQPPASDAPLTLVVIGASDAFGIGTDQPRTQSWPSVLASELSSKTHLVDLGIPGATAELAARDEVPVGVAAQPQDIAILLGINDLDDGVPLATFNQQLRGVVSTLRSGTTAAIYIANFPELTLLPYFAKDDPITLATAVAAWNADIAAVCASSGATLVDLFTAWSELAQHPEYVSADGLHPSAVGAQRIAQAFFDAIEGHAP
jgi:lysophospholipase L1-like esterase